MGACLSIGTCQACFPSAFSYSDVPKPPLRLALERLAQLLILGGVMSVLIQLTARLSNASLPIEKAEQFLIWAAPMVLYIGIAVVFSMLRGQSADGIAAATGIWVTALVSMPMIVAACGNFASKEICLPAVLNPAMTLIRPTDPSWQANRIAMLVIAVVLILASLLLTLDEERLLRTSQ